PARRRERIFERPRLQRRWLRPDLSSRPRRSPHLHRGNGALPTRGMATREESHRHRRLLRRLLADSRDARMASDHTAARRPCANLELLPREHQTLRADDRVDGRRAVSLPTLPFVDLRPADDAADIRAAIDRVIARGWFVRGR